MFKGPGDSYYPSKTAGGGPEGRRNDVAAPVSSLDAIQEQLLNPSGVQHAVLNCLYAIDSLNNPDAAIAVASAVNDWLIAEWLEKEPRLRASMVVPVQLPAMAAREIDRVGDH